MPFVRAVADLREAVRETSSTAGVDAGLKAELLKICDAARSQMARLGVKLDDRPGQKTAIKFEDPERLKAAEQAKARAAEEKRKKKAAAKAKEDAKNSIHPEEMYKPPNPMGIDAKTGAALYSQWDDDGIPTTLAGEDGREITEKKKKKLRKAQASQRKRWEKFNNSAQ